MTTRTPETVLEQVVKLLGKTVAKGATAEEAAAAAAKAQSLMFAYNLSSADVSQRTERGVVRIVEGSFGLSSDSWRGEHYWQRELLRHVCKFNFTMVLEWKGAWNPKAQTRVVGSVVIIGTRENIAATEYLYAYLYREIHKQAMKTRRARINEELAQVGEREREYLKNSHSALGVPGSVVWERSFGDGAVAEIEQRLRTQRLSDEADVTAEQGVLIVTLDREVEEAWYQRKYGKPKSEVVKEQKQRAAANERAAVASAAKRAEASATVTNTARRPKKEPKPRYSRETYDYRAEELGRSHGKSITIREGLDGEPAQEPKQLERGA